MHQETNPPNKLRSTVSLAHSPIRERGGQRRRDCLGSRRRQLPPAAENASGRLSLSCSEAASQALPLGSQVPRGRFLSRASSAGALGPHPSPPSVWANAGGSAAPGQRLGIPSAHVHHTHCEATAPGSNLRPCPSGSGMVPRTTQDPGARPGKEETSGDQASAPWHLSGMRQGKAKHTLPKAKGAFHLSILDP